MRASIALAALAALASVAACSEPAENVPAIENAAPVGERTPAAPEPAPAATPAATASSAWPPVKVLPKGLLGGWTADPDGDCAAANPLRIDVSPDAIAFHESRARITAITQVDPHSWSVDAEFTGEGERWTKSFDLNLNEDGSMTRVEAPVPDVRYTRCKG